MSVKLPIFPLVITEKSFTTWVEEMVEKDLLFHFEDDAHDCLGHILSAKQCNEVNEFLERAFNSDFDPMEVEVNVFRKANGHLSTKP